MSSRVSVKKRSRSSSRPRELARVADRRASVRAAAQAFKAGRASVPLFRSNELKGVDYGVVDGTNLTPDLTNNDGIYFMGPLYTGSGGFNRVGRKIRIKSVRVRGDIRSSYSSVGGVAPSCIVRMSIVHDAQPGGGAIPDWDDIFSSTAVNGAEFQEISSGVKLSATGRFRVLRDWTIPIFFTGGGVQDIEHRYHYDQYIELKDFETTFRADPSPPAPVQYSDVQSNALLFVVRCSTNANFSTLQLFDTTMRMRYSD